MTAKCYLQNKELLRQWYRDTHHINLDEIELFDAVVLMESYHRLRMQMQEVAHA